MNLLTVSQNKRLKLHASMLPALRYQNPCQDFSALANCHTQSMYSPSFSKSLDLGDLGQLSRTAYTRCNFLEKSFITPIRLNSPNVHRFSHFFRCCNGLLFSLCFKSPVTEIQSKDFDIFTNLPGHTLCFAKAISCIEMLPRTNILFFRN